MCSAKCHARSHIVVTKAALTAVAFCPYQTVLCLLPSKNSQILHLGTPYKKLKSWYTTISNTSIISLSSGLEGVGEGAGGEKKLCVKYCKTSAVLYVTSERGNFCIRSFSWFSLSHIVNQKHFNPRQPTHCKENIKRI